MYWCDHSKVACAAAVIDTGRDVMVENSPLSHDQKLPRIAWPVDIAYCIIVFVPPLVQHWSGLRSKFSVYGIVTPRQLVVKLIGPCHGARDEVPHESAIQAVYCVLGVKPVMV